jgi:hypothetical protein
VAYSAQPAQDGGYVVAGQSNSFGAGSSDAWVLKLDAIGNVIWQRTYGGAGYDVANALQPTADGGYVVAGVTTSFGSGLDDAWVLKLDASGNVVWQKTYGGPGGEYARSVQPTADGGYIVAGATMTAAGALDAWLLKLDAGGDVSWQKTYGGAAGDAAASVQPTADGGYVVAGFTFSFGAGDSDVWVLKLDTGGNVAWQRTYGGPFTDQGTSVRSTGDGGYIVAAYTDSFGAGGARDAWVLKLDANGAIVGCADIGTSNALPAQSAVIAINSTASAAATSATPIPTAAVPGNSAAATLQRCHFAPTVATEVPALSERALVLTAGLVALFGAAMMMRRYRRAG